MADKSVSLNSDVLLMERKENLERAEARKAERKSRPQPEEVFYVIGLKQAGMPGLPSPGPLPDDTLSIDIGKDTENPEAEAEAEPPVIDVTLKETQRILLDLVSLSKSSVVTAETN